MNSPTDRSLRPPGEARKPLWIAIILAAASGPVLDAAFPGLGWWPFIFPGIALALLSLVGRTVAQGFLLGFISGLAFYFTHIAWASLFLGLLPMLALSVLESLFWGVGGSLIALAYRVIPVVWPTRVARLGLVPIVIASVWVMREATMSVWPYGGFAWGRVALSQSESPVGALFSWLGVSGVSFVMVAVVAVAIEAVRASDVPRFARAIVPVAAATLALLVPAFPVIASGELTVAAVQGNGAAGYFDERERGDLLQAQLDATRPVYGDDVDVVIWPEGASDLDPLRDDYAATVFDSVSERAGAPLVGGAITQRGERLFNTSLLWREGVGAVDLYDKQHPVPFGEYVPDREFWEPFAPDLIGLIQREYTPGTTDLVFDLGPAIAGINICFDIADDRILVDSVKQGAQLIIAQTNNADFGRTDESAQQLAIARVRALELGRSVVNISTVGTSAIVSPRGETVAQLPTFTPGAMIEVVETSDTVTPAVIVGGPLATALSVFGITTIALAALLVDRQRTSPARAVRRG